MKKLFAKLILKIIGWKIVLQGDVDNLDRCILVVAPHTHNSEYLLGNLAYTSIKLSSALALINSMILE